MTRSSRVAVRAGFTLLEVIVSTGITLVLLLACYQTIAMHYKVLGDGRELAENAQLSRALLARLRLDLAATYTAWTPPSGAGEEAESAPEGQLPPGGVLGGEDWLTLVVRVAPDDLDFGASAEEVTPVSDVRLVRYWLETDVTPVGVDQQTSGGSTAVLYREVSQRVPDELLASDPYAYSVAEPLADEVEYCSIRYYDGVDWLTTWDETQEAAPAAIEIEIGLPKPGSKAPSSADGPVVGPEPFRLMVALPVASTGGAP